MAGSVKNTWLRVWRTTDPRVIALLGALLIFAGSVSVFGFIHNDGFAEALGVSTSIPLSASGVAFLVLAQAMAVGQGRYVSSVSSMLMFSVLIYGGMLFLALQQDPVPFISTLTAAVLSLGVAWGFHVMTNQDHKELDVPVQDQTPEPEPTEEE